MIHAEYAIKHLIPMLITCIECKKAKGKREVYRHALSVARLADHFSNAASFGTHDWVRDLFNAAYRKEPVSEIIRLADAVERMIRDDLCELKSQRPMVYEVITSAGLLAGVKRYEKPKIKYTAAQMHASRVYAAQPEIRTAEEALTADYYADHVTMEDRKKIKAKNEELARAIIAGEKDGNFSVAQRMHYYLTGESVSFLPK